MPDRFYGLGRFASRPNDANPDRPDTTDDSDWIISGAVIRAPQPIKPFGSWMERNGAREHADRPGELEILPFPYNPPFPRSVVRTPLVASFGTPLVASFGRHSWHVPDATRSIESVNSPFLESTLLGACPELRESWHAHRRTFVTVEAPDDRALLDAVRRHVVGLLVAGRMAEFSRFARAMERMLGEADPVLYDLLREDLLRPLARDVHEAGVPHARAAPYLGMRLGLAWPSG